MKKLEKVGMGAMVYLIGVAVVKTPITLGCLILAYFMFLFGVIFGDDKK